MDEHTIKLIKERFDSLPKMVQEVILSSDYENSLLEIGKQYQLNVEQLGILEQETTLTMMGLTPTKDFEGELTRELKVERTKGSQIATEINEKVFLRIRDLLKLMNTPKGEEPDLEENIEIKKIINPETPPQNNFIKTTKSDIEEIKKNAQTFGGHGIEIIPARTAFSTADTGGPDSPAIPETQMMQTGKLELTTNEKTEPSILAQKLSTTVSMPPVKTEHSLENLTKTAPPVSYPKNADPYRLPPE